jgi:RNA ligase (TIGR02306 family)
LRGEGFRLKTVRLRGQISQGLALPLSLFPELAEVSDRDITELLRIEKWDPPVPASLRGEMAGNFPGCVAKTDQERIQNLPEYFEKYADLEFEITEKIDGCSMTAFRDADHFGICSHNWELRETAGNSFWGTGHRYDLEGLLRSTNRRLAIQCELAGPGIQSNRLKLKAVDIFAFDVWDIDQQRYLTAEERIAVLGTRVRQVPIIEIKPILKLGMAGLLSYASGPSLVNPGQAREGIVAKSTTLVEGRVISFKVISNQYLLTE